MFIPSYKKPGGGGGDLPEIVTWADGTDEQIVAMLDAHYNGIIDIHDYWAVGDERIIHINAMSASYDLSDTHVAQDITMVLMDVGGKELVEPIGDITECAFVVGQKDVLHASNSSENGTMAPNTITSNLQMWRDCARRSWCNNTYYQSFPETIRTIFKQHINYNNTDNQGFPNAYTTNDYFTLPAYSDVFDNTRVYENGLTQFEWYKTVANRNKATYSGSTPWWLRTFYYNYDSSYLFFYYSYGNSGNNYQNAGGYRYNYSYPPSGYGIAPQGVI